MKALSDKKRIEVATAHCMGLSAPMIEIATGVSTHTIRAWRLEDWFKELVDELQRDSDNTSDAKLTKLFDKALDTVLDRLERGDFMYDPKTSQFIRKPLATKDVIKITDTMFDKRALIRGKPTSISVKQEQVSDRLLKLATEFARFANAKEIKQGEIIDVQVITNGQPALESQETGRSSEGTR